LGFISYYYSYHKKFFFFLRYFQRYERVLHCGKFVRPSVLHCLGKNHIHLSQTNPCSGSSMFQKQSRLTVYCRHRATIRYVHTCTNISNLAEIESAAVGGICERESTVCTSLTWRFVAKDNIVPFDKLACIITYTRARACVCVCVCIFKI